MALGAQLREARMRLGLTTSEIAASTRMKVQLVDAIEHEDFSSIAAPIYGKGFIKLFAERVGVDPGPLVEEYVDVFVGRKGAPPQRNPEPPPRSPAPTPAPEHEESAAEHVESAPEHGEDDLFSRVAPQPESREAPPPATPVRKPRRMPPIGPALAGTFTSARAFCTASFARTVTAVREKIPALRAELKTIQFDQAPLKTIGVAVGLLVLLILIFSALSRYIHAPGSDTAASSSELQLAIDPPDPYME